MYELQYSNGKKVQYATRTEAAEAFAEAYPDGWAGHDGDLADGGDRTYCWRNEDDSLGDDGSSAVAVIVRL
ncbi:MAG: hypothetical protein EBR82_23515 [Caulobacteraceae bacterium]|nr:hypothetical protein [Caulobacteraceae bacterium]